MPDCRNCEYLDLKIFQPVAFEDIVAKYTCRLRKETVTLDSFCFYGEVRNHETQDEA